MIRPLAVLALAAPLLAQDTVASIEIRASRNTVLAARSLELRAAAANDFGRILEGFVPRWRSLNPEIAAVDDAGEVRGIAPGIADIEAADPNTGVADRFTVRVYPARVEITPGRPVVEAGQQTPLTARALDADGKAIGGVNFRWRSGLPGVASVDDGGSVRGLAEGSVTISASVDAGTSAYQFLGLVQLRVRKRQEFTYNRVLASDQETSPITISDLIPWGAQFSQGGENTAFLASLSNGSRALMLYQNGTLRRLVTTGDYIESIGVVRDVSSMSVNSAGDVLARISIVNCSPWVLFRGGRVELALPECWIPNAAIGERGEIAYASNVYPQSLMFRKADGSTQVLLGAGDPLPGGGPLVSINGEWVTATGHVFFTSCGSNGCPIYFWNGSRVERVVGNNDTIDGMRVEWWNGYAETMNGDVFLRAGNSREQRVLRKSGGTWSSFLRSDTPNSDFTYGCSNSPVAAQGNAILFGACANGGNYFYKWDQGRFERLSQDPGSCNAALTPQSAVVHRDCAGTRIQRTTASGTTTIAAASQSLTGAAGLSMFWEDIKVSGPPSSLLARSVADGLLAVASRAATGPIPGQTMPGGGTLAKVEHVAISTAGDVIFQAQVWQPNSVGLYIWRDGKATLLADNSGAYTSESRDTVNGFACCFQPLAANRSGQVLAWTSFNTGQALAVFTPESKTVRLALRMDGQQGVSNVSGAAIDDRGRVMTYVNNNGMFLSENGVVTRTIAFGVADSAGWRIYGANALVAAGDRFYSVLNTDSGQLLVEFSGNTRRTLSASFTGHLSANQSGDLLITGRSSNVQTVVLRKADGTERVVATATEPTADGEWFLDLYSAFLTDAGDIYFSARTSAGAKDRIALFRAVAR